MVLTKIAGAGTGVALAFSAVIGPGLLTPSDIVIECKDAVMTQTIPGILRLYGCETDQGQAAVIRAPNELLPSVAE